ncbi:unnamed protein product [Cunninghamella echinulata]
MWFLYYIVNNNVNQKVLLRPSRKYTLGRKVCEDKSISKYHATLKIENITEEYINNIYERAVVTFYDDSKFGSYVNSKKVEKGESKEIYLKDGDIIKLGTKFALFKLKWEPLVICRQNLSKDTRLILYNNAADIGAKITQNIGDPFTHLYMDNLQLSYKVIQCLAQAKPIISQKWVDALCNSSDTDFNYPPINPSYLPPIDQSFNDRFGIPDFKPNTNRSKLFKNKIFLFFDEKQHDYVKPLVVAANGICQLYHIEKIDPISECIGSVNKIVIQPKEVNNQMAWNSIVNYLDSFERRVVDEHEIGLAIAYCSMEFYCCTRLDIEQLPSELSQNQHLMQSSVPSMDVRMSYEITPSLLIPSTSLSPHSTPPSTSKPPPPTSSTSRPITSNSRTSNANHSDTSTILDTSKSFTSNSCALTSAIKEPEIKRELDLEDIFDDLIGDGDNDDKVAPSAFLYNPLTSKTSNSVSISNKPSNVVSITRPETITSASNSKDIIPSNQQSSERKSTTIMDFMGSKNNKEKESAPSILKKNGTVIEVNNSTIDDILGYSLNNDNDVSHDINNNNNNPIEQSSYDTYYYHSSDLNDNHQERLAQLQPSTSNSSLSIDNENSNNNNKKSTKGKGTTSEQFEPSATPAKKQRYEEDLLPELKYENNEIIKGKQYSNVRYKKMVLTPYPKSNLQTQQVSSNVKNVKRFKKSTPAHFNPLQIITMQSEHGSLSSNRHSALSNITRGIDNDFDDVRIRPTRVRI